METITLLLGGFGTVLQPLNLLMIVIGLVLGLLAIAGVAHAAWLGPQMLALLEHYARGITIDPAAFEEAIEAQLSGGLSPDRLAELGQSVAGQLFQPTLTPEQVEILGRLETLVAVVEGWVDDVVGQTTAGLMPRSDALLEMVRRRRAASGPPRSSARRTAPLRHPVKMSQSPVRPLDDNSSTS